MLQKKKINKKNLTLILNNIEKYSLFCVSLLESFKKLFWYPDIIICNDWQTAILPILLKNKYNDDEKYKNIKTINFIHSIDNNAKSCSSSNFRRNSNIFSLFG